MTQVLSTRFLGLIIDDVLSWTEHMNALSREVAQKTRCALDTRWTCHRDALTTTLAKKN